MPDPVISYVTPFQLRDALLEAIALHIPVCIWSPPGMGKTAIVHQAADIYAQATGIPFACKTLRAIELEPVDTRGIPHPAADGYTDWLPPRFWPQTGAGIIFLDEVNRADVRMMNALLQPIHEHRIGDIVLSPGYTFVAACNPDNEPGVTRMPPTLANRFTHLYLQNDASTVLQWSHWADQAGIHPLVIAFLRNNPAAIYEYSRESKAFPTHRAWEAVSQIVYRGMAPPLEIAFVSGTIGHGHAMAFLAFCQTYRTLPNLDGILLDPMNADIPSRLDVLYATAVGLSQRANERNFGRVLQYLDRLAPEYSVFAVRAAFRRDDSDCAKRGVPSILRHTPEAQRWQIKYQDVL